ncbi:MAG: hypothetical protein RQ847_07180 [Wenzhouxiangellaceae bacterium]|nr:hypothetical protein [Wenzhouxiangellaceae bacterium]
MLRRLALSLAGGIITGIVAQESAWLAMNALLPEVALNAAMLERDPGGAWLLPLLGAWLLGGAVAGLMATLIGRRRFSGHLAGAALTASALLLVRAAWPDAGGLLAFAITPSLGAALGTAGGLRLLAPPDARSVDRLRAHGMD